MIACLAVPYFAAAVERRANDALLRKPLAIGGQPWEARPAYAFSQEVASQGVRSGMSLRSVQVLSPHSHFLPAARPYYSQVSAEMIDVLTDFSPLIEPQELWHAFAESEWRWTTHGRSLPARYCLDLDGLPSSEAIPFAQEIGRQVRRETSFAPAIGLAAGKFTAQVAAAVCRPGHLLPVAVDSTPQFLSGRPVDFLPLDKETARRLELLGIRTLGQFMALPLPRLREQFGRHIEPLYRLAHGQANQPLQPAAGRPAHTIQRHFPDPLTNRHTLSTLLTQMVDELTSHLQASALEGDALRLAFTTEDGRCQQQTFSLSRPTADPQRIAATLQAYLATISFSAGVVHVALNMSALSAASPYQLNLFAQAAVSSPLANALQTLTAKYNTARFLQPILADSRHPLPERRFQLQPFPQVTHDAALA